MMWIIALAVLMTFLFSVLFFAESGETFKAGRAVITFALYSLIAFLGYMAGQS